jgi:hypothetical protein
VAIGRFTAGQDGAIEVDAGGLPGRHRRAGAGRVILAAEILAGRRARTTSAAVGRADHRAAGASNTGVITVCSQRVALGRVHRHQTVTIHVSETTLAIELDDGETRVVRRTTTLPLRNINADRPWMVPSIS